MHGRPLILCCWPGLARLWLRGEWSSFFAAISFSVLLNLALVSSFVWPLLLSRSVAAIVWLAVVAMWTVSAVRSYRLLAPEANEVTGETGHDTAVENADTLFIQAQTEYLKGDWKQAENLLFERLESHARDVEARLLLAAVLRRTGRLEKAAEQLNRLGRFDAAAAWEFEIHRERQFIEHQRRELIAERQDETTDHPVSDSAPESSESGAVGPDVSINSTFSLSDNPATEKWSDDSAQRRAA